MVTLVRLGLGDQAPCRGSLGLSAPPQRESEQLGIGRARDPRCVEEVALGVAHEPPRILGFVTGAGDEGEDPSLQTALIVDGVAAGRKVVGCSEPFVQLAHGHAVSHVELFLRQVRPVAALRCYRPLGRRGSVRGL